MKISGHEKIRIYNERLQSLYGDVIRWLKEADIPFTHLVEDHALAEEHIGHYVAKKLIINQDGEILAKFIPVGLLIIGAEGRVDLVGKSGKEILVYFSEGGPEMITGMSGTVPRTVRKAARSGTAPYSHDALVPRWRGCRGWLLFCPAERFQTVPYGLGASERLQTAPYSLGASERLETVPYSFTSLRRNWMLYGLFSVVGTVPRCRDCSTL